MASYSTTANVILTVNGKQAQKMLSTLEKDAKRLEKGIAKHPYTRTDRQPTLYELSPCLVHN